MKKTEEKADDALADSNILLYANDKTEPVKRAIANTLIEQLVQEKRLIISAQSLNEFYNIATSLKRPIQLDHTEAKQRIEAFIAVSEVYPVTQEVVLLAMGAIKRHQLSLWDSLIWAVAKLNGVTLIYTEDMPSASEIEGVRYINPFV